MSSAPSTRARILRAAAEQFLAKGFQRTSLQSIAAELALTKATILYHFPTKDDLAAKLLEPLLADLESAVARAKAQPPEQRAWAMIEGWLDTMLAHRQMLGMLMENLAMLTRQSRYQRLLAAWLQANETIAGAQAGQRERVRAVQAIAMVSDPVVYHADMDAASLRADMLDGVRRLLAPQAADAGDPPHRRGRPSALSPERVQAARAMYAAGTHGADEIAASLGVSRATIYRHLR